MKKLIIEARVNEYTSRAGNRHVPWTPSEIAEAATKCRKAGASVIHFHARSADGSPAFDVDTYAEVISRIRDGSDILIHATLGAHDRQATAEQRLAHIVELSQRGLAPDFASMDLGSTNADRIDPSTGWFLTDTRVYTNSFETLKYFAKTLRAIRVRPQMVIWNLPMLRAATAFMRVGLIDEGAFVMLGMSEGSYAHHPRTPRGLQALIDHIPSSAFPLEWSAMCIGGSMLPMLGQITLEGGHLSIGLGDYGYLELGEPDNAQVVAEAARQATSYGRQIANTSEARQMFRFTGTH